MSSLMETAHAGTAFDRIAADYDDLFTRSQVGSAQRAVAWEEIDRLFDPGETVLELNCGTGEDALHLARRGVNVVGCDSSVAMVDEARRKLRRNGFSRVGDFRVLPSEQLRELDPCLVFDGGFSNFAGLNCVADWRALGKELARRLRPGGFLVACVYAKYCLWETLFYAAKGDWRRATRRWHRTRTARLGEVEFNIYYRAAREMKAALAPWFRLRGVRGVGVLVPPSYLEAWSARNAGIFRALVKADRMINRLPGLRSMGDHVLLTFERNSV